MRTVWITRQGTVNQNFEASVLYAHTTKSLAVERAQLDGFKRQHRSKLTLRMLESGLQEFRRFEPLAVLCTPFEE